VPNPLVTLHDLLPETHPHLFSYRFRVVARAWFRASARRARHVFTVSEYARGVLVERYRLPPDKVSITANGVDFERFRGGRGQDPSEVEPTLRTGDYLLMVGRLDPRKNHVTALDALARLRERRSDLPRLVIAGSAGSAEGAIRERIQNLGLSRQVLILRDVDSALLPRLYANALATISTSIGEGFGLPLVEAMAAGCAVICADNTAQTEVVAGSGLLFDSGDADALADLLERVIDDNALRGELVRLGTIRAREFDWRVGASAMLDRLRRFEPAA
jgi:glycosyltransferase involved in cell wall biosynthesis